ncbi:MAG: hypothetical protein IPK02_00355 [Candidatus Accumulibacter sp.]|uniref:Uncharacterized protein n=1 Tax=Candidatus Accumulibacter affinis TaxID=2954384 RepID=A0A935T3Y8_9PROT|nr:hypothetical protein [Candidatus Accumulibacter affinis]
MIRSILYLDEQKLYSLSSQVLEGLTEYLLTETSSASEESETQKGPVASGKVLADAMKRSSTSVERRVLHDHALALFEDKLLASGQVVNVVNAPGSSNQVLKSFIRVAAPASFIDAEKLNNLLGMFNRIGEALAYVTNNENIQAAHAALEAAKTGLKDKTKLAQLTKQAKELTDAAHLAKASGLYQDPKFLENLSLLTNFAFSDQLEVQQRVDDLLYSTPLKRDCLREPEGLLIRKYSRKTEKSLVVLGLVTQTAIPTNTKTAGPDFKPANMKEAVTNMVDHIAAMESSLSGKIEREVVIDPIAVYVSL